MSTETDWTFPSMSTEDLVARRAELHRDIFTEYVGDTRRVMRRAIVRINEVLLDRRGHVYGTGETWRVVVDGWLMVVPGRTWATWISCHDSGLHLGGSGVAFRGTLTDGHQVARTHDGHEYVWVGAS